jgi:small GTP-binding protein
MTSEDVKENYRAVVLGAGGVGKSALVIRYITDNFIEDYDPTIEDSYRKNYSIDGVSGILEIVDTAGQEGFGTLLDQWIRRGKGFVLVYSITSLQSFEQAVKFRDSILSIKENDDVPIVLVGNKCDLESQRKVSTQRAKELAEQWKCAFLETSAKEKINTSQVFTEIVKTIRKSEVVVREVQPPWPRLASRCTIL